MELTFVHQYSGDSLKRRRLAKACESCRARKKRCVHYSRTEGKDDGDERPSVSSSLSVNEHRNRNYYRTNVNAVRNDSSATVQERTPPPSANGGAHFFSDIIPEATFLDRPPPGTSGSPKRSNGDIGVWVDRREWEALVKQKNDAANTGKRAFETKQDARPSPTAMFPLVDLYFEKIHPILPLLDETEFRRGHEEGLIPEALLYAMILAVAKDVEAEPHLRLSSSSDPVSARQFCNILHASVTGALQVPVRFEKVTLIRILVLTSLHSEGPEGAEAASIKLSQAMHYAQTLGIHLGQQAAAPVCNDLVMKRLFWCLYALDRTSAAINGRPIIMSDADIAIAKFAPGETGFPAFEAWLKIGDLLNKVIDFYRPIHPVTKTGWEDQYPGLEEIIDDARAWELPASVLNTIHLFYLTVAILSHRTRGIKETPRGMSSYVRQRLCAVEIVRLMDSPTIRTLHPLPVVPYAVSLALSVAYQHLRQSQLEHQQADALHDFRTCCRILQDLRRTWCSADVMATLAKKVLEELDRAPDLASFRVRRAKRHAIVVDKDGGERARDLIPPPTACHHGVGAVQQPLASADGSLATPSGAGAHESHSPADASLGHTVVPHENTSLFDNMDDVFGTFMDPNYPLNLEDMSFVDDFAPLDWQGDEVGGADSGTAP